MRALLFTGLLMVATPAMTATTANKIVERTLGCWSIPGGLEQPFRGEFEVKFDNEGTVVDVTVLTYEPKDKAGKETVISVSDALQRCSPYKNAAGTMNLIFDTRDFGGPEIDPFKGN